MKAVRMILGIIFITTFRSLLSVLPLTNIHNVDDALKFNVTLVVYSATTEYLKGPEHITYSPDNNTLRYGFVFPRSKASQYLQPNTQATYSLRKLMRPAESTQYPESLLTEQSIYMGQLKMRTATKKEANNACSLWVAGGGFFFDYEDEDLTDAARIYFQSLGIINC